jgi:peptidylprolyl isomerase/FKBP-type peptidyl-prolyl cis-trans isomerase FklB
LLAILALLGAAACTAGRGFDGKRFSLPPLTYVVNSSGPVSGNHPHRRDKITVRYSVMLPTGELIDSSAMRGKPDTFELSRLVPAWQVVLPLMRPGDDWTFYVPPQYAYGATSRDGIPAGSSLIFRVELMSSEAAASK